MTLPVLRPSQAEALAGVYQAWANGARNVLLVSPTGSGKTVMFCHALAQPDVVGVAIAHRQEIVAQISLALARNGVRHRIIGAKSAIKTAISWHMDELKRSYYDPNARCAVAGVDTLVRMAPDTPWLQQVNLWVQDECFQAGTLVNGRPIESIRVGDFVDAFDQRELSVEPRRVVQVFKNSAPKRMMRVGVGHHVLNCTLGHPFYTERGWVYAGDLTKDDYVLLHTLPHPHQRGGGNSAIPVQENRTDFLPALLRVCAPHSEPEAANAATSGCTESKSAIASDSGMYGMRGVGGFERASTGPLEGNKARVLQPEMQQRIPQADFIGHDGAHEPQVRLAANDRTESDAACRNAIEGVQHASSDETQTASSGRQWQAADDSGNDATRAVRGDRICPPPFDSNRTAERDGLPPGVQARLGEHRVEDSDRSGWCEPPRTTSNPGPEERGLLEWARVDNLEVYERSDFVGAAQSNDDGFVYNIEVEGLHTYIANGVVVHNCHHLLTGNKWGTGAALFPNARGLGVTATPNRADGRGLGRHADGVMDAMVVARGMRDLINDGHLTDYRIFAPPSHIDLSKVPTSAGGDFSPEPLRKAVHAAHITGDVVDHYIRIASGKLGVTFAVDIEAATEIAQAYRDRGVTAEVVSNKTPDHLRASILRRFRRRGILQLVNVDLFGEGFDLPAIEVVSMARPTQSFPLYSQQMGRGLRPMPNKTHAIIIDHVNNTLRHGLPDAPRIWTLDRRESRGRGKAVGVIPTRTCLILNPLGVMCMGVYERVLDACPYCGGVPDPAGRNAPHYVDGNLFELDADTLKRMRGEVADVDRDVPKYPRGATPMVVGAIHKMHYARRAAQTDLRSAIALWAGWQQHLGRSETEAMRRFFHGFGTDVLTATALGRPEAEALATLIQNELNRNGVVPL